MLGSDRSAVKSLETRKEWEFLENIMPTARTKSVVEPEGRERILQEAHALFLATGFAEVSMQQIADVVGMTKAALYYHFSDKQDLFAHVVEREATRVVLGMRAELEKAPSFREQLLRLAPFIFQAFQADMGRLMADFKRHVTDDRHLHTQEACQGGNLDPVSILRPYFEAAIVRGELRELDVEIAIVTFLGMIFGMRKFTKQGQAGVAPSPQHVGILVDLYLHGASGSSERA